MAGAEAPVPPWVGLISIRHSPLGRPDRSRYLPFEKNGLESIDAKNRKSGGRVKALGIRNRWDTRCKILPMGLVLRHDPPSRLCFFCDWLRCTVSRVNRIR